MNQSLEEINRELERLREEVEGLRAFRQKWDTQYPGLLPEAVKHMENQLRAFYAERDEAKDLVTEYQKTFEN